MRSQPSSRRSSRWRGIGVAATTAALVTGFAASAAGATGSAWVGTWGASPQTGRSPLLSTSTLTDQTIRNIVYSSVGGNSVRIRLSNAFGRRTVTIGRASVGVEMLGAQLVGGSVHALTFGGHRSVSLPAGAEALSDPVSMHVPPLTDLAVSLFVPRATGPATNHTGAEQVNYLASGNHATDASGAAFTTTVQSWYFVDGVQVRNSMSRGTVVTLGDSITDGTASQVNANDRWPNFLARRLVKAYGDKALGVMDEGIGGNRILHNSVCFGINAPARLATDVLTQPGLRDVILLEGINDIGFSQVTSSNSPIDFRCFQPNTNVSAQQIIRGYQQIINRAHAAGVKVFGGTLTPFRPAFYWSPSAEKKRDAVNRWIRTSGAFDGVIDFAAAIAMPGHPEFMNPKYDSGDHLHPNDAGYQAMANAINLAMLQP